MSQKKINFLQLLTRIGRSLYKIDRNSPHISTRVTKFPDRETHIVNKRCRPNKHGARNHP